VERHRVYAVDVVGQSVKSVDRRLELDDDSYGRWLAAVCAGLGITRTTVFGVSWGGFVALRLLTHAPALVSALILLVPAGLGGGSAWAGLTKVGWPMLTYRLSPSEKRLHRLVDGLFTSHDERWTRYFGDAVRSYRMDMRVPPLVRAEDVARYAGPTLVLGADQDVSFPGPALLARAKELFPNAELELLEGCKHCPPVDPLFRARTASRIEAFLARAPA
jgi:pimeloyl-ACP methyl ester carboxylesterase